MSIKDRNEKSEWPILCKKNRMLCCRSLTLHGKYWSSCFPMPRHPLTFLPQTNSSPRSVSNIDAANNSALYLHGSWQGHRQNWVSVTTMHLKLFEIICTNKRIWAIHILRGLPVIAAKWLRPQRIDETFTVELNSDLPNNVAGILSGIADSERFGPFPRIPKPQTNTSPSSTESFCFNDNI